jgi:hypothetical protein
MVSVEYGLAKLVGCSCSRLSEVIGLESLEAVLQYKGC